MEIEQLDKESLCLLKLKGRLDTNTSAKFEQKIVKVIDNGQPIILIDCSMLDFISSAGLRVLLMAGKRLKNNQGYLALAALASPIKEAFDISGFSALFNIYDTADNAMTAIAVSHPKE